MGKFGGPFRRRRLLLAELRVVLSPGQQDHPRVEKASAVQGRRTESHHTVPCGRELGACLLLFLFQCRKRLICDDTPLTGRIQDRLGLVGSHLEALQQGQPLGDLLVVWCALKQPVKFTDAGGDLT